MVNIVKSASNVTVEIGVIGRIKSVMCKLCTLLNFVRPFDVV